MNELRIARRVHTGMLVVIGEHKHIVRQIAEHTETMFKESRTLWGFWFVLWLTIACLSSGKMAPSPVALDTFVTFKQAHSVAQEAAQIWDENAVLTWAYATSGDSAGETVILNQDGMAAHWFFNVQSPMRLTTISVINGQSIKPGAVENAEMICVGGSWVSLSEVAQDLDCEYTSDLVFDNGVMTVNSCIKAAIDRGEIVCDYPNPVAALGETAIPVDELIDSDEAAGIAQEHGFAGWKLASIELNVNTGNWVLLFESKAQRNPDRELVIINARTGKVQ